MSESKPSEPTITLAVAFMSVELTAAQASSVLQWMGQQLGGTEAGAALRDGGIALGTPPEPSTARTSSSTSTSKTSSS